MSEEQQIKFTDDMRRIMIAVQEAKQKLEACCLKIEFSENGGLMTIILESKKRYK